jgi:hypothetical protein
LRRAEMQKEEWKVRKGRSQYFADRNADIEGRMLTVMMQATTMQVKEAMDMGVRADQ